MGRIFEKRKVKMFARWAKTAKAFTKLGKEISVAVRLGSADPAANPRLRMAIQTARSLNMPKDRIEAAVKRASSRDEASLDEVVYPAYGPHGVAMMIVAATDNPTRTVANVREKLGYHGGSLASGGAMDFLFKKQSVFRGKPAPGTNLDELELQLIDAGLEELIRPESSEEDAVIYGAFEQFRSLQETLEKAKFEISSAGTEYTPTNPQELSEAALSDVNALIESLEDDDDVQHVFAATTHD